MSQVMITPWNPEDTMDIDEVYVELSFLRDDRKLAGTEKEKLEDYTEIFEGRGHHLIPKRILVYGRPGIGKSTFAKKLAVDWSRGKKQILKKFDVSLLIKLRDVCKTQDITSMLQEAELLSVDDPTVFNKLYEYILQNQQKVLLVLDGYDEYSGEKSSPVYEIWKGVRLPDCTVLVTTRPSKEEELRAPSHAQFEINGFDSREQIKKFALKFLHHQGDVGKFTEFLTERDLWDMAKIPLLLLMLCLAWKDKENPKLLTSRADLYKSLFDTLFDHVAAKNPEQTFTSVDEYKEDLSKLGKLAFNALMEDCLYFKLSKLPEDIRALIEKFIGAGFFQISNLSSSRRREQGVFFLHKTIQEFLSAWFIVQELTSAKEGEITCLSQVDSFEKVQKMVEVLKFVCELSSEATSAVLSHLRVIGEKEGLIECSFTETPSVEDLSEDQREFRRISLDCLLCCPASGRQDIFSEFVHCVNSVLMIDQDQLPLVAREHALKFSNLPERSYLFFRTLSSHRVLVDDGVSSLLWLLLRDLETVLVTCYGDTTVEVEKCHDLRVADFFLKKEGGQMILYLTTIRKNFMYHHLRCIELLRALTSAPESPPQKPVDHVQNRKNSNETESTSGRTENHSLSFVREIKLMEPTSEELTVVTNALPFVNGPRVIDISIILKSCDDQLKESLFSCIPFTNSLYQLKLSCLNLTAKSAIDIFNHFHQAHNIHELDLSRNNLHGTLSDLAENLHLLPQLTELNLSHNNLHSTVIDLAENLHHLPQLTQLSFQCVNMGDKECRLLAESLKFVGKLQVLHLSSNPLGQGITELAKHLFNVPHLTELKLGDTQMGEKEVTAVARSLQSISKLKSLYLSSNPLAQGITELATHLPSVPHLTVLNLIGTQMGEKEVTAVARALKDLPELKRLSLSYNPLGRGVSELTQHLSSIPQLGELWLRGVKMTKKEASELCAAVQGKMFGLLTDYHVSFLLSLYFVFTLCIFYLLILKKFSVSLFQEINAAQEKL